MDTDGAPKEGLPVYAFDGETYTGFDASTNASGEGTFVLPIGSYRFRSDLNGTQFWSSEANHCDVPGCHAASVTVTIPVTVSVLDQAGTPYPDLPVYAFSGDTYTGFNGTSDAEGNVIFTLPTGDYRFRADLDGVQFWSGEVATCTIPGCTEDTVTIPGGTIETDVTIDYTYDPLYRLTAADYSSGKFFHYIYDAVGNRLTQETHEATNAYTYDIANRLTSVDGISFTWDANGNLISDGDTTYTYDVANRLRTVVQDGTTYSFSYNGLGDRVGQTVSDGAAYDYALDLAAGLTQVLDDGTNSYLYGRGRIGEEKPAGWQYHLGDALGSVRGLASLTGTVSLARSFAPFGSVLSSTGSASTAFSFTGEQSDRTGLTFLRARYLDNGVARFLSRDPWVGDPDQPMSYNGWLYVFADPIGGVDPSGMCEHSGTDYCRIDGGDFDGAVIDLDHYGDSKAIAQSVRQALPQRAGQSPGQLNVETHNLRFIRLAGSYRTWIPQGADSLLLDRITLGISMDFQWDVETFQAAPCWLSPFPFDCSGFANEDLPSDYLGFMAILKMPAGSSLNDILARLGARGGTPTNDRGAYDPDWLDTFTCFRLGECGEDNPYNCAPDFTFKLFNRERKTFLNRPWPSSLQMEPIGEGQYWDSGGFWPSIDLQRLSEAVR
jgi:RHS repeat-associated protein